MKKHFLNWTILVVMVMIVLWVFDMSMEFLYPKIVPWWGQDSLAAAIEEKKPRDQPHPYMGYKNTPNYFADGFRQHNGKGYRNSEETTIEKSDSVFRILTLGGSTTYGQGVNNPNNAWPSVLEKLLNDSIGSVANKRVEVINSGLRWATTAELLGHYLFRDRYLNPDLVIVHTGGNDTGPLSFGNYNPEYTHWRGVAGSCENGLSNRERSLISFSNTIKVFYGLYYAKHPYRGSLAHIYTMAGKDIPVEEALENVHNNVPTGFGRNLQLLLRNLHSDGADVLYFQYYAPGRDLLTGNETALAKANQTVDFERRIEVLVLGYAKTEAMAKTVCSEENVAFLQISQSALPVSYFVDQCHLDSAGQAFKAEFLGDHIIDFILAEPNSSVSIRSTED
ncbi:MAG: SGNH/GDSL hydrolase family protein [Flavobacteriales bacterium]|nr:SGNH/GDSL hydrolase family protein [Flavobacteriales bacterium]